MKLAKVTLKRNGNQKTGAKLSEEKQQWNKMSTAIQANINIINSIETQS